MKVSAILYTSNTGYTRTYARMLGEETGLPVYDLERDGPVPGSPVLYLGWLRAGSVVGLKKAARRYRVKAYCGVGMAAPGPVEQKLAQKLPGMPSFYLRGGYDGRRLKGIHRLMMSAMEKSVARAVRTGKDVPPDGAEMLRAVADGANWVSRDQLLPVLAWLKEP